MKTWWISSGPCYVLPKLVGFSEPTSNFSICVGVLASNGAWLYASNTDIGTYGSMNFHAGIPAHRDQGG